MSRFLLAAALAALLVPAARAQPAGFDVGQLDAFFSRPPKVEVNLRGALLRLAASATDDDPETASMLRGLKSILVRVYALDSARDGFTDRLDAIERQMQSTGWETLVRVRPDGEDTDDVWVYVREAGDAFDGMAVVSLDHDEGDASFVLIDGLIDPSRIGALGGRFGVNIGTTADSSDDAMDAADAEREAAEEAADAAREAAEGQREAAREARDQAREQAREAARIRAEDARIRIEDARIRAEDARAARRPVPPAQPAAPAKPARPSRPS